LSKKSAQVTGLGWEPPRTHPPRGVPGGTELGWEPPAPTGKTNQTNMDNMTIDHELGCVTGFPLADPNVPKEVVAIHYCEFVEQQLNGRFIPPFFRPLPLRDTDQPTVPQTHTHTLEVKNCCVVRRLDGRCEGGTGSAYTDLFQQDLNLFLLPSSSVQPLGKRRSSHRDGAKSHTFSTKPRPAEDIS
jgi:hypothetical protein